MNKRKILFRGKRIDNGEWVFGDLLHNCDCVKIRENETEINHVARSFPVLPKTIGQYTGLTDKNGTRIFEGDIVKAADKYIDYAIWANGCFCMARQTMYYEFTYQNFNRMEVIGNIYDNPELLKGE